MLAVWIAFDASLVSNWEVSLRTPASAPPVCTAPIVFPKKNNKDEVSPALPCASARLPAFACRSASVRRVACRSGLIVGCAAGHARAV